MPCTPAAPTPALISPVDLETPPPQTLTLAEVTLERRGWRVDFADRDARNRALGRSGESWALEVLKKELEVQGRSDLAARVEWVSQTQGDGLGYDIASFDVEGRSVAVEVKTTNGAKEAPFLVSANEVEFSQVQPAFRLYRVFSFSDGPRMYVLRGPLRDATELEPVLFRARVSSPRKASECPPAGSR